MSFSIRNPEAERLARNLAESQGVTITEIVTRALRELSHQHRHKTRQGSLVNEILEISERCGRLRVKDHRTAEEILGYSENGVFDGN